MVAGTSTVTAFMATSAAAQAKNVAGVGRRLPSGISARRPGLTAAISVHGPAMPRHDGRADDQLRPLTFTPGIAPHAAGSRARRHGQHAGHLRGVHRGRRAALDEGTGRHRRLDHGGIFDAAVLDAHAAKRATSPRASRTGAAWKSSGSSAGRCARRSTWRRSGRARCGSIATCSRPTAARARRRSPAAAWRRRWRSSRWSRRARWRARRCGSWWAR